MTATFHRLRRPRADADEDEQRAYRRAIAARLNDMGVNYGQEFVIMPADAHAALLETPKARATDPDTSNLAALRNEPKRNSQRWEIIALVCGEIMPLTANDIAKRTGLPLNSVSTRMGECVKGEWLFEDGTKLQDGSERTLYSPTPKAQARRWS